MIKYDSQKGWVHSFLSRLVTGGEKTGTAGSIYTKVLNTYYSKYRRINLVDYRLESSIEN
jgi:hypothetical protein